MTRPPAPWSCSAAASTARTPSSATPGTGTARRGSELSPTASTCRPAQAAALGYDATTGQPGPLRWLQSGRRSTSWVTPGPGTAPPGRGPATNPRALRHAEAPLLPTIHPRSGNSSSSKGTGQTKAHRRHLDLGPGATWTKQEPTVHSPPLPRRRGASLAYDPATGTAVLSGGGSGVPPLGDTWTWG